MFVLDKIMVHRVSLSFVKKNFVEINDNYDKGISNSQIKHRLCTVSKHSTPGFTDEIPVRSYYLCALIRNNTCIAWVCSY